MNPDLSPPWRVTKHQFGLIKVENKHRVIFDGFAGEEETAHLAAAAPELLEALREAEAAFELTIPLIPKKYDWPGSSARKGLAIVQAALTKASGDSD